MASFVSAKDRPPARGAGHANGNDSTKARLRESLSFLRHVEGVEISGMARNWDAKKCFLIYVTVHDNQIQDAQDTSKAQLMVVRPTAPFQIERTPKQLQELQDTIQHWSRRHAPSNDPCSFCSPIASGAVAIAAKQEANDGRGGGGGGGGSSGFFRSLFSSKDNATTLKTGDEWESWLNASISRVRQVDVDTTELCDGVHHAPPLLARFLLQ